MNHKPEPLPEGVLLRDALARAGTSARQAAKKAGISEGRWRQIVNGYQVAAKGVHVPVRGPAGTVAAMAQAVDVTPEQLRQAGRADAAEELEVLTTTTGVPAFGDAEWDGDISGPHEPLAEGEWLRWRRSSGGVLYLLTVEGVSLEATLGQEYTLDEAVRELRRTLVKRIAAVNSMMVDRLHT